MTAFFSLYINHNTCTDTMIASTNLETQQYPEPDATTTGNLPILTPTLEARSTAWSTETTPSKKKKKKRKKNTNSSSATADVDAALIAAATSQSPIILTSKLSAKKQLHLKKSVKHTPWYDVHELVETGRGLLLALKLFPSPQQQQPQQRPPENHGVPSSGGNLESHNADTFVPIGLTPQEYSQLQNALHRIALWRGRSDRGGRLPHAIDMTAGLAGALLMDARRTNIFPRNNNVNAKTNVDDIPITIYQLRNSYSTLLLRSVNGLADMFRHQKKSAMLSVSHCCSLAGLPLWIVDVRHDASHNDLPSLGVCRIGALESLRFWGEKFWAVLEERVWGALDETRSGVFSEKVGGNGAGNEDPGGICALAMRYLENYQKAAMTEARERKVLDKNKAMKEEKRQEMRLQQRWDQRRKAEGDTSTLNSAGHEDVVNHTAALDEVATGDTTEKIQEKEEDVLVLPSEDEKVKKKGDRKRASSEQNNNNNGGRIAWWVLGDDSDDKPKKKKKKTSEKKDNEAKSDSANVNSATNKHGETIITAIESKSTGTSAPSNENKCSTSRDIAAEFLRIVPIDISFSAALRFLVWGRSANCTLSESDNVENEEKTWIGPALLPPPASTPLSQNNNTSKEELFDNLRVMYDPFLIGMVNAYPGFLPALFVHLLDSFLCVNEAISNLATESSSDNRDGDDNYSNQLHLNSEIISKWARYIVSREFHMHFDRSVAIFFPKSMPVQDNQPAGSEPSDNANKELSEMKKSGVPENEIPQSTPETTLKENQELSTQCQPIDLKKKGRKRWSADEIKFMQSALSSESLKEMGLPLNSVCDRLVVSPQGASVANMLHWMEDILGGDRIPFMGIHTAISLPRYHALTFVEGTKYSDGRGMRNKSIIEEHHEEPSENSGQPVAQGAILSLEDMEAMLGDNDEHPDERNNTMECDDDGEIKNECAINVNIDQTMNATNTVAPWTLCKSWDACAIGVLPGYPA